MNRDTNISNVIDGNAVLSAFHKQQNQLPAGYGMIRDGNTTVHGGGSKPIEAIEHIKPLKHIKQIKHEPSSSDTLRSMVDQYNTYIHQNDLPDNTVDFNAYSDVNNPNSLDLNDTMQIKEEQKYLQNQLYRMQKDKMYVPDYEDVEEMDDATYEKYAHDVLGI